MATFSRSWETVQTETLNNVTTGSRATNIALDVYEGIHVQVQANSQAASPVDDLDIEVYASIDDGTTDDTVPIMTMRLDLPDTNNHMVSFLVTGYRSIEINYLRSGSTDTIDVTQRSRRWRWTDA